MAASPQSQFDVLGYKGTPIDHGKAEYIERYSPVLVIFPDTEELGPPSLSFKSDYHPSPVEMFLSHAGLFSPRIGRLTYLSWVVIALLVSALWLSVQVCVTHEIPPLRWLLIPLALLIVWLALLWAGNRQKGETKIKDRLSRDLANGLVKHYLDNSTQDSATAWRQYQSLKDSSDFTRQCYVRVNESGNLLCIQYWFFYPFNDAYNRHQSDWEFVVVFLWREGDRYQPKACGYSKHTKGSFRYWDDRILTIGKSGETHPIAYVARGSHAFYFEANPLGHETTFPRTLPVPSRWGRVVAEIAAPDGHALGRDHVPSAKWNEVKDHPTTRAYDIQIIPKDVSSVTQDDATKWEQWWWIRYRGYWSPGNAVPLVSAFLHLPSVSGPMWQDNNRSGELGKWATSKCEFDAVIDLSASTLPEASPLRAV